MNSISFANVWLLFIAVPLVLLFAVPYFVTVNRDNRNGHNIASVILHIILAVLMAFAAAGTAIESVMTETDVYVVADVSYSASRNLDVIDGYISRLSNNLPGNSRLGIVCFGGGQQVITIAGDELRSVKEADAETVDVSRTDIADALEYTSRIFRSNVIKRIVLITDGGDSNVDDDSALRRKVEELNAEKIYVDAIYLDDNITSDAREVQMTSIECGQTVYGGQQSDATAIIQSTYRTAAGVSLYLDGELVETKETTLNVGSTSVVFTLSGEREAGVYNYEVRVTADGDESPYNNSCIFTQEVISAVNVLFITDVQTDAAAAREAFGEDVTFDAYVGDPNVPYTVADLCEYDEIVLSNVDVGKLTNYEMFIESLDTVVSMLGKSLVTIGNLNIQNTSDEYLIRLSDMLPVRYGNASSESRLFTIVIDGSHSMAQAGKFDIAKSAAKQLVSLLSETDRVAVVMFYGNVEIALAPTVVSDKSAINDTIDALDTKQGTLMSIGLNQALTLMRNADYDSKQILLISDGLNSDSELDGDGTNSKLYEIVDNLAAYDIATSVIDVGRGGDTTSAESVAAKARLEGIAQRGSGTYWFANSQTVLDESIFAEISNTFGETVVDRSSYVDVNRYFDDVLEGVKDGSFIDSEQRLGYISGFVSSRAKASATTVLTTDYQKSGTAVVTVPVYSYWKYGNGKAASFTSSISGSWVSSWNSSGIAQTFFADVLTTNIPSERSDTPYTVDINEETGYCTVEIAPVNIRPESEVTVKVSLTYADGETRDITNVVFDSSVYRCSFALTDVGTYRLNVSYDYKDESYSSHSYVNISYLSEYDAFATYDAAPLYKMIGSGGTVSEDGELSIVNDASEMGIRTIDLSPYLLIAAVVIFAADIIVRKLKWNDIRSLFKKVKGRKEKKQ